MSINLPPDSSSPWCKNEPYEKAVILNFYAALGFIDPKDFHQNMIKRNSANASRHGFIYQDMAKVLYEQDQNAQKLKYVEARLKEEALRQTGKSTRAALHFIFHRFFMEQDCVIVDHGDTEYSRKSFRMLILQYVQSLQAAGMLSKVSPADIIIFKASDFGWWPKYNGNIIYHKK